MAPGPEDPRRPLVARRAGAVLVSASLLWAGAGLIGRGSPMSGPLLAFWRSVVGAVVYQLVLARRGRWLRWADVRTAALGGAAFGLSVVCLFVAYKSTTLISANVIGCLQPLALGAFDHRQGRHLGAVRWAATSAAVLGTVLVVVGSSSHTGTWSLHGDLFALAGTGFNVVYVLGTKRARRTMGPLEYQASALWVSAAVTLPVALLTTSLHILPAPRAWWWVVALVAVGGSGHLLFSAAQRHVSVAASSAILLLEVVAVALGAAWVYGQSIGALQAVGMVVVAGAVGVWLTRAEGVTAPGPPAATPVSPAPPP